MKGYQSNDNVVKSPNTIMAWIVNVSVQASEKPKGFYCRPHSYCLLPTISGLCYQRESTELAV